MPLLTGPGCIATNCVSVQFPILPALCNCTTAKGGIGNVYAIPCTESLTAANIMSLAWWADLIADGNIGTFGRIMGSLKKKSDKKERISSCSVEEIQSLTWALSVTIKCFDKTSADTTTDQVNTLLQNASRFLFIARMCEGDDSIIPIGSAVVSDFDWDVPDNFEDLQKLPFELSWIEFGKPKIYQVAGLSSILPKNAHLGVATESI